MEGLLILATVIAVVWLCFWSVARPDGRRRWSPFDMHEDVPSDADDTGRADRPGGAAAPATPPPRTNAYGPWTRSGS
ncbi:hypothetical protein [Acidisphaera rubrifaciens]|uniref:Uncharacterized protein n=1 Tax=Acidisphaera rubrifaciens HS-AP3 TaxID=1231350 RepID=A0A0D6P7D7_9PROT|nr:hypothetical protein [Acidisphaera rubrifaciens]GAN77665.1 hypothetical protein Asru_0410_10 [Acidisphaera rubrifaciens HS-AP3]